jgi:hypothetical protein
MTVLCTFSRMITDSLDRVCGLSTFSRYFMFQGMRIFSGLRGQDTSGDVSPKNGAMESPVSSRPLISSSLQLKLRLTGVRASTVLCVPAWYIEVNHGHAVCLTAQFRANAMQSGTDRDRVDTCLLSFSGLHRASGFR